MKISVSHKKEADTDEIDEMVRRIVERFDPDQIILFGSHAPSMPSGVSRRP